MYSVHLHVELTGNKSVTSLSEEEKDKIEEAMVRHGCTDIPITDKNVVKSVQDIMVCEVPVSRLMALDAIVLEINAIQLGDLLRAKPTVQRNVFPSPEQVLADAKTLKNKMSLGGLEKVNNEIKMNAFQWFLRFASEYKEPRG